MAPRVPPLSLIDADWLLSDEEIAVREVVRRLLDEQVRPHLARWYEDASLPARELAKRFGALGLLGMHLHGYGCAGASAVAYGLACLELEAADSGIRSLVSVQGSLAMFAISRYGSEEQKQQWLPPMARLEKIGSFGLTEPNVGSGTSGGLTTTARRDGDTWILNGQKKWIGNATFGDVTIIWARDLGDNQVKGFIVENKSPGFKADKIEHKMALRVVQNALITLDNCRVPEANRLQLDTSFRDTARVLRMTRAFVGWEAVGCMMGAYEHALRYAQTRLQFGKPIGSFQLVQDLLVKMIGNITASLCMMVRLSKLQDEGKLKDEHASLAKAFCTVRMRESVGYARELLGANGIVLDHQVGRFVADAEAIYSYEGTREMQTLIVGRSISGFSAFV
jgi:glutaryl-CoA dehydrogenase